MRRGFEFAVLLTLVFSSSWMAVPARAQLGNSGSIEGVVKDPSGGAVANVTVEIWNPVSGYKRETTTGSDGSFRFTNVPFNPYHFVARAKGFATYVQDAEVRSTVPTSVQISLKIATAATTVTVESNGGDLVENDPVFHTDVDKGLFDKVPLESQSSSLSSLVTLTTPGVVADSNGLFHGLGEHADNSFSYDGQPITDQQSKVFSNQIPPESIQSMEVISGAPPAEFGDKTSVIIKVTTRSGLGQTKPTGSVKTSYGSFGSVTGGFDVAFGGQKWGNFIAASGLNTSRFLDPPEFHALHDRGNEENLFDRVDYQVTGADTIHVNLGYSRSWFQTPNTIDNLNMGMTDPITGNPLSQADQRSLIRTFNIAPVWTRLISTTTLFTLGAFVRKDQFGYFPSVNPFADGTGFIPGGSSATLNQQRTLTNVGLRSDVSYVKGINNIKAGVTFEHTFLTENFSFGITNPAFNDPASPTFQPVLGCYDLTRPVPGPAAAAAALALGQPCNPLQSALFPFHGHTDIKQIAFYLQDTITKGNWAFNVGFRVDLYRGIVRDTQPEPRVGIAYNIKKTNTVLRVAYSRIEGTPFNENLILASVGASNPVIVDVVGGVGTQPPIRAAARNQFNTGFQQAFGKFLVVDADYFWKYTRNGYDFSAFANTPIFFPIAWHNSKLSGVSVRVNMPTFHGLTAFAVLAHVNARFFPPQVGGLGNTVTGGEVFRIDHDQAFNQTTYLQYQPWKNLPWIGFSWRYDSGLVASNPNLVDFPTALGFLDADQQAAIGLFCGGHVATLANPLTPAICAGQKPFGAKLVRIPLPGQGDVDHNPTRVASRNLFDSSVGDDNIFRSADRYRWSLRFTVINLTNKETLYNFLSTFSGTHFVTPRTYTAEVGFHF
jgi:hypothetical protein